MGSAGSTVCGTGVGVGPMVGSAGSTGCEVGVAMGVGPCSRLATSCCWLCRMLVMLPRKEAPFCKGMHKCETLSSNYSAEEISPEPMLTQTLTAYCVSIQAEVMYA